MGDEKKEPVEAPSENPAGEDVEADGGAGEAEDTGGDTAVADPHED